MMKDPLFAFGRWVFAARYFAVDGDGHFIFRRSQLPADPLQGIPSRERAEYDPEPWELFWADHETFARWYRS